MWWLILFLCSCFFHYNACACWPFPISVMMFIFLRDGSKERVLLGGPDESTTLKFFNVLNYCLLPYLWSSLQCLLVVSPIYSDIHISCLIVLKGDLKKKRERCWQKFHIHHFNLIQLQCLKKCPGNYLQALKAVPRTLRMM